MGRAIFGNYAEGVARSNSFLAGRSQQTCLCRPLASELWLVSAVHPFSEESNAFLAPGPFRR